MNFLTIDVDRNRIRERTKIAKQILSCPYVYSTNFERSSSRRGWHITIFCTRSGCEKCRKLFDDRVRFKADHDNRKPHQQNVLFQKKVRHYPREGIVKINRKLEVEVKG